MGMYTTRIEDIKLRGIELCIEFSFCEGRPATYWDPPEGDEYHIEGIFTTDGQNLGELLYDYEEEIIEILVEKDN